MSYRLQIYGVTGTGTPVTTLSTPDFTLNGWAKAINGARNMAFSLHKYSAKATATILQKQRIVTLLRRTRDGTGVYAPVWTGYIRGEREIGKEKSVECVGLLDRLTKRYTAENENFTGQGSAEVFGLLTDANAVGATGIVQGTGGVTSTRSVQAQGAVTVLSMIEKLALAHTAEYEVDDSRALNFVPTLGTDKSDTIELVFRRDGTPGNTVDELELGEDATEQANRIIGFNGGGLTSTYNDATSQSAYGILVERKQFNEAQNQAALDAMTANYGPQVSNPPTEFRAVASLATKRIIQSMSIDYDADIPYDSPDYYYNGVPVRLPRGVVGLQYDDVAVGDLVKVIVITGNNSIEEVRRIAEISVSVSANERETLRFTLSKTGIYVTAAVLEREEVRRLKRRIQEIDALV